MSYEITKSAETTVDEEDVFLVHPTWGTYKLVSAVWVPTRTERYQDYDKRKSYYEYDVHYGRWVWTWESV